MLRTIVDVFKVPRSVKNVSLGLRWRLFKFNAKEGWRLFKARNSPAAKAHREPPMDWVEEQTGLRFVSSGLSSGCGECAESVGSSLEEYDTLLESNSVDDEGSFSWGDCGICDTRLGGQRYVWHGVDAGDSLLHFDDACTDCVMRMAGYTDEEIQEGA